MLSANHLKLNCVGREIRNTCTECKRKYQATLNQNEIHVTAPTPPRSATHPEEEGRGGADPLEVVHLVDEQEAR
jgi:hypothetical protein